MPERIHDSGVSSTGSFAEEDGAMCEGSLVFSFPLVHKFER